MPRKKILGIKNLQKSKKITLVGIACLVLLLLAVVMTKDRNNDKVELARWCAANYQKVQNFIDDESWPQAKELAAKRFDRCKDRLNNAEQFTAYFHLALSSYMTNDKKEAKDYSVKGLDIYKELDDKGRSSLDYAADMVFILTDIKLGIFQSISKAQNSSGDQP